MTSADLPPGDVVVRRDQLPLPLPYVAPRTPTETALAGIWCTVLGMDRIGLDDAYHDLGGDSFLATIIFEIIRETFRVALPMAILVTSPTIADLATKIDSYQEK